MKNVIATNIHKENMKGANTLFLYLSVDKNLLQSTFRKSRKSFAALIFKIYNKANMGRISTCNDTRLLTSAHLQSSVGWLIGIAISLSIYSSTLSPEVNHYLLCVNITDCGLGFSAHCCPLS